MKKSDRQIIATIVLVVAVVAFWAERKVSQLNALAQTLTVVVTPNTPFKLAWDYPTTAATTTNFRVWVDGAIAWNLTAAQLTITPRTDAPGTSTITTTIPGLTAGLKQIQVSAWSEGFPDAKSTAIPVNVNTAPTTPFNLRLIVDVKGGGGN